MGHPLDARRHDAAAEPYRDMRESDGIDASLRLWMPGCQSGVAGWGVFCGERVGRKGCIGARVAFATSGIGAAAALGLDCAGRHGGLGSSARRLTQPKARGPAQAVKRV